MIAKETICREVITHAICGKGTKYSTESFTIRPDNPPTTIGGCWVMNHTCSGTLAVNKVQVSGQFDLNVWYSFQDNSETAVAKETVHYSIDIPLVELDPHCTFDESSVDVRMVQEPNCLDAVLNSEKMEVAVTVEMGHQAELIGRTKLWVLTCDPEEKKESFSDFSESFLDEDSHVESSSVVR